MKTVDWFEDVLGFHKAVGQPIGEKPSFPPQHRTEFRLRFLREELDELETAIDDDDLVEAVDAITDIVYVAVGMAVECGVDLRPVWDEVQQTNMAKVGGPIREDGKQLKPEGWTPPNIQQAIAKGKLLK